VEYDLKTGVQGHIYFPKKIREMFGKKIKLLPNSYAGVIYPENADPARVINSLKVIIAHLRLQTKEREAKAQP